MTMESIRKGYGVPAKRGARVRFLGQQGTIVSSAGAYLRVRIDSSKCVLTCHPTWEIEYLNGPHSQHNEGQS